MKKAYIVKHNHTGIWGFAFALTENEARDYVFNKRREEFQQYTDEMGEILLEEVRRSLEVVLIGQETQNGLDFKETKIEI